MWKSRVYIIYNQSKALVFWFTRITRVLSYRKAFHVLCLHTSIMATDLRPGKELPLLKYSAEMIIAFKSTRFDLHLSPPNTTTRSSATHLVLYNVKNDIILRITIRNGQNKVFFNDRADKSLLDGWGQEQSADLSPVDVQRWKRSGVTISVHYPCPRTRFKYQILFDLTTVFYFAKRFPEPVTKIGYSVTTQSHLSDPLKVFCYEIDDLPLVERQAIKSGKWVDLRVWCFTITHENIRVPLPIPAPDSAVIPIPPSDLFPNQPQACISLDNGKEVRHLQYPDFRSWSQITQIRIYRLGPGNILHEYIYSSKDGNSWHCAAFHNLKIVLEPTSSITAVLIQEYAIGIYYIGIYYQGRHLFP